MRKLFQCMTLNPPAKWSLTAWLMLALLVAPCWAATSPSAGRRAKSHVPVESTASAVSTPKAASATKSLQDNGHTLRDVKRGLQVRIKHFEAKGDSLRDIAFQLQDYAEVLIVVSRDPQWAPEPTVTFNLDKTTVEAVLNKMASQGDVAWTIDSNETNSYILISSRRLVRAHEIGARRESTPPPSRPRPMSAGEKAIVSKLDTRVPAFAVSAQPMSVILDKLHKASGLVFVLDPALDAQKLPPVTLDLKDVSVKTALELSTRDTNLKWTILDNRIFVSTHDGVLKEMARSKKANKGPK